LYFASNRKKVRCKIIASFQKQESLFARFNCPRQVMKYRFALAAVSIAFIAKYTNDSKQYMSQLNGAREQNAMLNLAGKRAVVVGATSGIGRGIAERLVQAKMDVTVVGRESKRSEEVLKHLNSMAKANEGQNINFVKCNCFLLSEVNRAVDEIKQNPVDYLVMTQGMATIQGFTPSKEEGLDQKLALHVYSRAAFAGLLVPAMAQSNDPRVLSVLSAGVHSPYSSYKTDPELSQGQYSIKNAADAGGFYNDIVFDKLSEANPGINYFHACPGFVNTNWGTEMPGLLRFMIRGLQWMGRSRADCAEYMVRGMTNPEAKAGSLHLLDQYGLESPKLTPLHSEAKDFVFEHIQKILTEGNSVAGKK
jgi:NAD(P)-dependent dehydrogenase (short-subunit alcohol dehydrogenase family)